ncbi:MAG: hypothetical protein BroJett040_00400 [Oligoflexia bacterium]|nr:MAG: hypothetical protein BroJett040_00400 [Oligoflexia bacterium]
MGSQAVFYFIIGLGGFFAFIFMYKSKSGIRAPSRLNLKAQKSPSSFGSLGAKMSLSTQSEMSQGLQMKNLNVLFMYNGHSWDAYEVLGIPAGSGRSEIDRAYAQMIQKVGPDSKNFIETAYRSLTGQ